MHVALLVDEIVALVASHTLGSHSQALTPRTRPDTSSTLGLALVRRSFLNPVCNVLWRRLDSLRPLLALIPTSAETNEPSVPWDRYFTYANRVRHLTSDDPEDAEALTHFVLSWRSPGAHSIPSSSTSHRDGQIYLTPNLHSLHITIGSAQAMHLLPSLLAPSLLLLDLHAAHPPPTPTTPGGDGGTVFMKAIQRCTCLQHLSVCTDWAHDRLPMEVHDVGSEMIRCLRSLRSLALDVPIPITSAFMDALRRLPDLEDLKLFVFSATLPTPRSSSAHDRDASASFGALHSLILSGPVHVQLACLQALPVIPTLTSTELITSDPDISMDDDTQAPFAPVEPDAEMMHALDRALRALGPNAAHEVRSPSWEEMSEESDLDDFEAAAEWNARGYSSVAYPPQSDIPVAGGGGGGGVQVH